MKNLKHDLAPGTILVFSEQGKQITAVTERFRGQIVFHRATTDTSLNGYPIVELCPGGAMSRVSSEYVELPRGIPIAEEVQYGLP